MIDLALKKIKEEIQTYLNLKTQNPDGEEKIILGSVSNQSGNSLVENRLYMSLINIERERVNASHQQVAEVKPDNSVAFYNPEINLNLFVIFSALFNDYSESLKFISHVISFFQMKTTFTGANTPGLDPSVRRLTFEIFNQSLHDVSYMWSSMLGNSYQPSILYKVRLLSIQEKQVVGLGTAVAGAESKTGELK